MNFFSDDQAVSFKKIINAYCQHMNYHDFVLSNAELEFLSFHLNSQYVTPEARVRSKEFANLHPEIKRSLARAYCFELVLRGDRDAYSEFVAEQNPRDALEYSSFERLSAEAQMLSPDAQTALRATCFLTISTALNLKLKMQGHDLSDDSEEFLSQLAPVLLKNQDLIALTQGLNADELNILCWIYGEKMHFRQYLFTEGGCNMLQGFLHAINADDFDSTDFLHWKWRWLINMFGFQIGAGAKFYDKSLHELATLCANELVKVFDDPEYDFMNSYLSARAKLAGFDDEVLGLSSKEQQLLGHIAAQFNLIHITNSELGRAIYEGYQAYGEVHHLAELYDSYRRDPNLVTPTYVPAILNSSYFIFKNVHGMDDQYALRNATEVFCQFLEFIYQQPHDQRISCMTLAQRENLEPVLAHWLKDRCNLEFSLNNEKELAAVTTHQYENAMSI